MQRKKGDTKGNGEKKILDIISNTIGKIKNGFRSKGKRKRRLRYDNRKLGGKKTLMNTVAPLNKIEVIKLEKEHLALLNKIVDQNSQIIQVLICPRYKIEHLEERKA